MKQLLNSAFKIGLFLITILFVPSTASAQSNEFGQQAWDSFVSPSLSSGSSSNTVNYNLNISKSDLDRLGINDINWVQYGGISETKPDGSISVTLDDADTYKAWNNFMATNGGSGIPAPTNSGYLQLPNQELGGYYNTSEATTSPATTTPSSGASQDNGNTAPDISQEFQDVINDDIAGLEVELPSADDVLSGGNATCNGDGVGGLSGVCANAGNIFNLIACKAMMFLVDLRFGDF